MLHLTGSQNPSHLVQFRLDKLSQVREDLPGNGTVRRLVVRRTTRWTQGRVVRTAGTLGLTGPVTTVTPLVSAKVVFRPVGLLSRVRRGTVVAGRLPGTGAPERSGVRAGERLGPVCRRGK